MRMEELYELNVNCWYRGILEIVEILFIFYGIDVQKTTKKFVSYVENCNERILDGECGIEFRNQSENWEIIDYCEGSLMSY